MPILKVPVTYNDHIRGNKSAPVTLLQYGDYECPYCALAHPVTRSLLDYFNGQLRFVFRHFPLREIHPHAEMAAETAELAAIYGLFWEMHDSIYDNQAILSEVSLAGLVEDLDIPLSDWEEAIEDETYQDKVRQHYLSGVRNGVDSTPSFYINSARYNGPYEFDALSGLIGRLIPYYGLAS